MSITKLISQGKAYDELFTTADYIQTDDGVGIYPAYENILRSSSLLSTNIVYSQYDQGYFVINVPSASTRADFFISTTDLIIGKTYTVYFESSLVLDKINVTAGTTPFDEYYNNPTPNKKETFDFTVSQIGSLTVGFFLFPFTADKDKNIEIKYCVVPKSYPLTQSFLGTSLLKNISSDIKSYHIQLKNYLKVGSNSITFMRFRYNTTDRIQFFNSADITKYFVSIRKDDTGGTPTNIAVDKDSLITISINGAICFVYSNTELISTSILSWTNNINKFETVITGIDDATSDIAFLATSTEVSTGYIQGSEPSIIPTCKLGLSGSEIDLPSESRTQGSINRVVKELESESANATLHTQFIATKDRLAVSYDVISEENRKKIKDIEALQWENNTRLSYIYNEESGNLITKTVKATVTTGGNKIFRDRYFDSGLTIEMKE